MLQLNAQKSNSNRNISGHSGSARGKNHSTAGKAREVAIEVTDIQRSETFCQLNYQPSKQSKN